MIRQPITYLLIIVLSLIIGGCNQAKYVNEGNFLLKKNEIVFYDEADSSSELIANHPFIDESEMRSLIRPSKNRPIALFIYNRIDPVKHQRQIEKKTDKGMARNERRKAREDSINFRRVDRAVEKGDSLYPHKVIHPKPLKPGWREWVIQNFGEFPVAVDTNVSETDTSISNSYITRRDYYFKYSADSLNHVSSVDTMFVNKRKKQLEIYLRKKGFYHATVSDTVISKKRRKAIVQYQVDSGEPYRIRNFLLDTASLKDNGALLRKYAELDEKKGALIATGNLLDEDMLEENRKRFTRYCRDEAGMLGFNKNYIGYVVDTTIGNHQADVTLFLKPKLIKIREKDSTETKVRIKHHTYRINSVLFNLQNSGPDSFKDFEYYKYRCDSLFALGKLDSLNSFYRFKKDGKYPLLDTLRLDTVGIGVFLYNEIPFVNPYLLNKQNFLEIDMSPFGGKQNFYKEYYTERSFERMTDLGVFDFISVDVKVDSNDLQGPFATVDYELIPAEKNAFNFDPRFTNSNGIFGIEGRAGFTNKNVRRGAQRFQFAIEGGMEAQPLIIGQQGSDSQWGLNTFEIGTVVSVAFPRVVPGPKPENDRFSKRDNPKTTFDVEFNYQKRREFQRTYGQFTYNFTKKIGKTQELELNLVKINYLNLTKEAFFEEQLQQLTAIQRNSYIDHLAAITSAKWHFNNFRSNDRTTRHFHDLSLYGEMSGQLLTPVIYDFFEPKWNSKFHVNEEGQKEVFNAPYTQFWKIEGQYIANFYLNKRHHLVGRSLIGIATVADFLDREKANISSLPYDQAFFAGGSSDIRAFEARTMAPGSTKTYADSTSTITQIGDLKLELNLEWRFDITSAWEGAVFIDAGNIWNIRRDTIPADDPSVWKWNSSWKEVAIGVGYGVRLDMDYLILRFDFSFALHNPHLPVGERWVWDGKTTYKSELYFEKNPDTGKFDDYISPHPILINFGIGYPF